MPHPYPKALEPLPAAKLGKLIRLLASDQPGEVLGAAQALRRVLEAEGLDLHDLAHVLETAAAPPLTSGPDIDWVGVAYYCLEVGHGLLNQREHDFVANMAAGLPRWREPTEKQARWLQAIATKVRAHADR
jgi:hypothetical protein